MPLLFHSTNGQAPVVDLREALLEGQAPDRGLYIPDKFPRLNPGEIAAFKDLPYHEIALRVLSKFTDGVIPQDTLAAMCRDAYDFPVPLEKIYDRVFLMRLDQGPTSSFKDFAAQMMARMFGYFLQTDGRKVTILTATSGDTGSAVAHAFHNVPNIRVIVLFPFDEVSLSQRKLMTTLADNVRTIAVDGKFDDCQAMVKRRAFADPALETYSVILSQFHQHRPIAATERLLFLRGVAPGQTGRENCFFHYQRKFRRHDGRGRGARNGPAGEKNRGTGERKRRISEISIQWPIPENLTLA